MIQNGVEKYSTIKAINKDISSVNIYPNPAKNQFLIQSNCSEITIVDFTGKPLLMKHFEANQNQTVVNIKQLTKGVYFVLYKINGLQKTEKLLVEK